MSGDQERLKDKDSDDDEEYYPLFDSLEGLNFDHLRRKRAWNRNCDLRLEPEYADEKKTVLREFWDLPAILAVKVKAGHEEYFATLDWE